MSDIEISVTDAARNFADCVNRAFYQNQSFVFLKNGVPFARLVPAGRSVCKGSDLADALDAVTLSEEEARSWQHDLKAARKKLRPPTEKW